MNAITKRTALLTVALFFAGCLSLSAQELYVFTEPASNMPAKSISAKLSGKYLDIRGRTGQRYTPELMIGVNKSLMIHAVTTLSDMYSDNLRWESARVYAKYRFLSLDDVHRHFRMAVFGELAKSRNKLMYDELALDGDHSGAQAGMIITGLLRKFALSSTLNYTIVTSNQEKLSNIEFPDQAFGYSLSGGLLVLPVKYTAFSQTNVNIYAEVLGQRSLDMKRYYTDFAPALQLIFNSNFKVNLGYRFQIAGNMRRMNENSVLVGVERTFLGAFRRK
jgi:hypothetical protein